MSGDEADTFNSVWWVKVGKKSIWMEGPELAEIGVLALARSILGLEAWLRLSLWCEMLVSHKARPRAKKKERTAPLLHYALHSTIIIK